MASLEVSQWIFRLQFLKTSKCTAEKGKFIAKFVTERFPLHWAKMPTPWNLKVSSALNQSVKKGQNYTKVQRYMYNSPWTEHQIFLLLCIKILSANSLTDMIEGNGFINYAWLFNPLEWLASSFSLQKHHGIKHEGQEKTGNDHELKKLLILKQILLASTLQNV